MESRTSPRRLGRPGLSELTATVLLIAITLVAGAALYGYIINSHSASTENAASAAASAVNSAVGNKEGGFYATAQVSAGGVSCSDGSGVCTIQLTNTGSANTRATGCYLSGSGGGTGTIWPNPAEVPAGG